MRTLSRPAMIPWLLNLATRLLARSLNMPEPLLHDTGVFVFAQVQEIETSVGQDAVPGSRCCVACRPGSAVAR